MYRNILCTVYEIPSKFVNRLNYYYIKYTKPFHYEVLLYDDVIC